jgi:hypothetical protein
MQLIAKLSVASTTNKLAKSPPSMPSTNESSMPLSAFPPDSARHAGRLHGRLGNGLDSPRKAYRVNFLGSEIKRPHPTRLQGGRAWIYSPFVHPPTAVESNFTILKVPRTASERVSLTLLCRLTYSGVLQAFERLVVHSFSRRRMGSRSLSLRVPSVFAACSHRVPFVFPWTADKAQSSLFPSFRISESASICGFYLGFIRQAYGVF